ncbi:MAG TPA: hypothetical protein VFY13_07320 [Luteolibacter sp.]|nr:hypothetical protein [Luteolibacter sp.]
MSSSSCHPLTQTRALADFPIGNTPLCVHQHKVSGGRGAVAAGAWLDEDEWQAFLASGKSTLLAEDGEVLAWLGASADAANAWQGKTSFLIQYPWDLLRANEELVGKLSTNHIEGAVHPAAVIDGCIAVGKGTRILPGVVVEGNVIIGENCKIGPNCYLRGNTSIGSNCHIGQAVEIKNSLILSRTNVGHLSYVGDSVLGEGVNFGAGTIISNLRHDGANHRSMVDGDLIDTGRRKFGAIVGDGVHTGIHTSIYPGRKLWPGVMTRPGEVVEKDRV